MNKSIISKNPVLGIMGGMGPKATITFMDRILAMTDAKRDQEHIPMIICQYPFIPDRSENILNNSAPDPFPYMLRAGVKLVEAGVSEIAIPCVTAKYYQDELQKELGIPIIDCVKEGVKYLHKCGVKKVGILATNGTVQRNLIGQELERYGIDYIYPSERIQDKLMELIYSGVKAGRMDDGGLIEEIVNELREKGAERYLLGCTELSVLKDITSFPPDYIDLLDILAMNCVLRFGKLKERFRNLI